MRLLIAIFVFVLYPSSYLICESFFADENLRWHLLRDSLFSVNIFLMAYANTFEINEKQEPYFKWIVFTFMYGMLTGDFIDKAYAIHYNQSDKFIMMDIAFVITSGYFGYKKHIYVGRTGTGFK